MGTKNNPGRFDCYAHAEPDEPMFVLLGRDPLAPLLVQLWAEMRKRAGEDLRKCEEASACASEMLRWAIAHGKQSAVDRSPELLAHAMGNFLEPPSKRWRSRLAGLSVGFGLGAIIIALIEFGRRFR